MCAKLILVASKSKNQVKYFGKGIDLSQYRIPRGTKNIVQFNRHLTLGPSLISSITWEIMQLRVWNDFVNEKKIWGNGPVLFYDARKTDLRTLTSAQYQPTSRQIIKKFNSKNVTNQWNYIWFDSDKFCLRKTKKKSCIFQAK